MQFLPNFVSVEKKMKDGQIDVEFKLEIRKIRKKNIVFNKYTLNKSIHTYVISMKQIDLE